MGPDPIDLHVGQRLRTLRKQCGLTQTQLGQRIGVTFQQIQKYETGANRVSASALFRLAAGLGAPVTLFFAGLPDPQMFDGEAPHAPTDEITGRMGLVEAALRMPAPVRERLVDLARIIAAGHRESDAA